MYHRTAVYLYSMSDCFENKISTSPPGHLESHMRANSPATDITPNYQWPGGLLRNHLLLTPSLHFAIISINSPLIISYQIFLKSSIRCAVISSLLSNVPQSSRHDVFGTKPQHCGATKETSPTSFVMHRMQTAEN
jgi:hypothetical protein